MTLATNESRIALLTFGGGELPTVWIEGTASLHSNKWLAKPAENCPLFSKLPSVKCLSHNRELLNTPASWKWVNSSHFVRTDG